MKKGLRIVCGLLALVMLCATFAGCYGRTVPPTEGPVQSTSPANTTAPAVSDTEPGTDAPDEPDISNVLEGIRGALNSPKGSAAPVCLTDGNYSNYLNETVFASADKAVAARASEGTFPVKLTDGSTKKYYYTCVFEGLDCDVSSFAAYFANDSKLVARVIDAAFDILVSQDNGASYTVVYSSTPAKYAEDAQAGKDNVDSGMTGGPFFDLEYLSSDKKTGKISADFDKTYEGVTDVMYASGSTRDYTYWSTTKGSNYACRISELEVFGVNHKPAPGSPITSVKINGIDISEYQIVVASISNSSYGSPAMVLQDYLEFYCDTTVRLVNDKSAEMPHEIRIGKSARSSETLPKFSSKIYCKDGDIYICGGSISDCEQAVNVFICKYLDGSGDLDVKLKDDGSALYSHSGEPEWIMIPSHYTLQDQIVMTAKKIQHFLEYDHSKGLYYTYENSGYVNVFSSARAQGNRTTNCVIVSNWVVKDLGYWTEGIFNHTYDGNFGYKLPSGTGGTFIKENFEILDFTPDGKTENQLLKENNLKPGDIIFFKDHNQVIVDADRALDGGRGNCEVAQVGAKFVRFLGPNKYLNTKVGYIFRPKDSR